MGIVLATPSVLPELSMGPILMLPWHVPLNFMAAAQAAVPGSFAAHWSWIALVLLGAFHGVNPGMGWLFAVALGMQHNSGRAVWSALLPLAVGHGLAIGGVLFLASLAGVVLPLRWIQLPVALLLVGMGIYRIFRHCHLRWAAMRVGMIGLTTWSFLMASAHGAGLMVLPIFLSMPAGGHASHAHMQMLGRSPDLFTGVLATLAHGAGYLVTTTLVAWIVFEKLGVKILRKAWFNLDLIWAAALIGTGLLAIALPVRS